MDPTKVVFDVEFHVVPAPYWSWIILADEDTMKPDRSGAFVTSSVVPPAQVAHRPDEEMPFRGRWAFEPDRIASMTFCGDALGQLLQSEVFPRMRYLLARDNLLDAVRRRDPSVTMRMTPLLREIVLRIDDAPADEMALLLAAAEEAGVPNAFLPWARRRLTSRSSR
ncbi:hypothetical protein [Actinacidiphila glaucinigra]